MLCAFWGVRALTAASPITLPSYIDPTVDLRVVLFAVALTGAVGILLGLVPAVHLRSVQLRDVFSQSSRGATAGRKGKGFRNALVVAEVALAVLLLVGAGLFARSLQQMMEIRLGYNPSHLLTLRVGLLPRSDAGSRLAGQTGSPVPELLRVVEEIPGVDAVAAGSDTPLTGSSAVFYFAEGQPPATAQDRPRAYVHVVTEDFFEALQTPLLAGRTFNESEMYGESFGDVNVVVVSENVANRFWSGEDPIGKRIKFGDEASDAPWLTIIGVVNEMKYRSLPENPTEDPDLYLPYSGSRQTFAMLVRTSVDAASIAGSVRKALREAEPALVTYGIDPMDRLVSSQTVQQRFTSWLMGIFAVAALILAMIGIYGVLSYAVTRRSQEISVRMALGAQRGDVIRLVAGSGLGLVACGLAVGLLAALALTRLIDSLLYGIEPSDPLTFAVVRASC